jgi:hypothetical protein
MREQLADTRRDRLRAELDDIGDQATRVWQHWTTQNREARNNMWPLRNAVAVCPIDLPEVKRVTDLDLAGPRPDF